MADPTEKSETSSSAKTTPTRKAAAKGKRAPRKKRTVRSYPASSFEAALVLAREIVKHSPDGKIRRLTYLKLTERSATSSATAMLFTSSGKYGITKGSYVAEWLEVTPDGLVAVGAENTKERLEARFRLAIAGVVPFNALYEEYRGKKIPSHDVMKDFLQSKKSVEDLNECLDTFIVNAKFLGLLQTIAGSETLIPLDHVVEELMSGPNKGLPATSFSSEQPHITPSTNGAAKSGDWNNICFYMSPIGEETSEQRLHSNLFLNHLVEPALVEFGLKVIRADLIGESGMITSQILEHILKARLVIADLSFQNPNVFYELAIRHACKLPIVQIIRKADKIPFDVDQVRTIQIDNSGIYSLIPKLETYRSEIATHVRQALANVDAVTNPLTLFCPGFHVSLPKT
jgi:hypothetical protein